MRAFIFIFAFVAFFSQLNAHVLHYNLKKGALYSEVFFGGGEVASYSPFEIYAPGASLPFVKGNTDERGVLTFLPDRAGKWHVVVHAGSDHGEHIVEYDVEVKNSDIAELSHTPLYSEYGAMITGVSIIFGVFGLLYGLRTRKLYKVNAKN